MLNKFSYSVLFLIIFLPVAAGIVWAAPIVPPASRKLATRSAVEPKDLRAAGFPRQVRLEGTLSAVSGNTLTVGSYTVTVTTNTRLIRRFGGKSQLSEFKIGDNLQVFARQERADTTNYFARLIRDLSIQKRFGAFIGTVASFNTVTSHFTLQTANRGLLTVTVNSKAVLVNRKQEPLKFSDLVTGARVRVKGLWDKSTNTLTEVSQVKDYSLPIRQTGSSPFAPRTATSSGFPR